MRRTNRAGIGSNDGDKIMPCAATGSTGTAGWAGLVAADDGTVKVGGIDQTGGSVPLAPAPAVMVATDEMADDCGMEPRGNNPPAQG